MVSKALKRLREITEALDFPPTLKEGSGVKIHKMEEGDSKAHSLLSHSNISVARWWNSKGTRFPTHTHNQREWLIVYEGEMSICIDGKEITIGAGEYVFIGPDTPHSAFFPKDTFYVAITIPMSPDWPK